MLPDKNAVLLFSSRSGRRAIQILLLLCLITFHVVNNVNWLYRDTFRAPVQGKDWHGHAVNFSRLVNKLQHGEEFHAYDQERSKLYNLIFISYSWPPLYYYVALLIRFLSVNISPEFFFLTSTFFLIILLVFTCKLAEFLHKGTGLMAAFICSFFPFIQASSRFFNLELAVCAMVVLSIYLLLKTDFFQSRRYSIFFGLSLGLGMLIKYTFSIFLIGPLIFIGYSLIYKKKTDTLWPEQRNNLLLSIAIGILISGIYYFNPEVLKYLLIRGMNWDFGTKDTSVITRIIFYVRRLITQEIGVGLSVLIFPLFVLFFKAKVSHKKIVGLWVLLPIIIASFVPKYCPEPEYVMPLLPALAVISSIVLFKIRLKIIACLIGFLLVGTMLFQYAQQAFISASCFEWGFRRAYYKFRMLGDQAQPVALMADSVTKNYLEHLEFFLVLCSKNKARINSFFVSQPKFFRDIDKYDFIVNLTYGEKDWPTAEDFKKELIRLYPAHKSKKLTITRGHEFLPYENEKEFVVSENDIEKMANLRTKFIEIGRIKLYPKFISMQEPALNIYVFKRRLVVGK